MHRSCGKVDITEKILQMESQFLSDAGHLTKVTRYETNQRAQGK